MKHVKFIKRVKKWFSVPTYKEDRELDIRLTMEGKYRTFLRTTSHPCSCFCCKNEKDKRIPKNKIIKEAFELE